MDLLIRNGRVFDLDGDVHQPPLADLLIRNGVIAAIGPGLVAEPSVPVLDATGQLLIPGLVKPITIPTMSCCVGSSSRCRSTSGAITAGRATIRPPRPPTSNCEPCWVPPTA